MLPLHCLFSTGVSQQNCNSPPVTSLAKKPSGSSLLEKVTFVSSSQHSCTLICHVAIDLQVNGHNFFFPRPPLLLRVLHDTDCCTLQFINHHMSVLHNYLGDMLHFWLYVGCYQSARDNSTLDTPISALEGASPLRKQCCRQVLLHSILPLTAGGGQHTILEQELCSPTSSMIISFHDITLLHMWLNWERTMLHTHMKATAATVWLNVLLTRVHTVWYIAAA